MNYNSVNEIFAAGKENMTTLFENSDSYDDGVYTMTGIDFFMFNKMAVSNIYASGNSFFGFSANATQLAVNNRDTRMRSLYREEGTLYGYYRFLKIRWEGWSHYNSSGSSYQLKYDVLLWDTGDISLHMIEVPVSSYDGTFQLAADKTYTYAKPTKDNPDVTFQYSKDANVFDIKYAAIDLIIPFKLLIQDEQGVLYTIEQQEEGTKVLTALDETELTSTLFLTRGFDKLPDWNLIKGLSVPRVYSWSEIRGFPITAEITGTPPKQYVECTADLSDGTVLGIKALNAEYTGEVTEQHSFDGENFTEEISIADFLTCNMDELYDSLTELKTITFRFWLKQDATLTSFTMNYRNGDDDDAKSGGNN